MKLVPIEEREVEMLGIRKEDVRGVLDMFVKSGLKFMEVKEYHQKSATSCANSIKKSTKNANLPHITAITRKDRVILINELL